MVFSNESEHDIRENHRRLCYALNLDKQIANKSWSYYVSTRQNFTLDGPQAQWLAVAIYIVCRKPINTEKLDEYVEENSINLTQLLRLCNIDFLTFINKGRKWNDMLSLTYHFRNKLDQLEHTYAVSWMIFKKFRAIYLDLFLDPYNQQQNTCVQDGNKLCNSVKLIQFCWTLFVMVRSRYSDLIHDLVNSYHLLLACCDYIYGNCIIAKRRDILNPNFDGIPDNVFNEDYHPPTTAICIMDSLCRNHDGLTTEAKSIKRYNWKLILQKLFSQKILQTESQGFNGILDDNVFENNYNMVNNQYEEYITTVGNFDERLFLDENGKAGYSLRNSTITSVTSITGQNKILNDHASTAGSMLPTITPITARKYISTNLNVPYAAPVKAATQSVAKLHGLLLGRKPSPSSALTEAIVKCDQSILAELAERISVMEKLILSHFSKAASNSKMNYNDFFSKRLEYTKVLYYRMLENILYEELKMAEQVFERMLREDIFHRILYACSLEIVIYSYSLQPAYLWVFDVLNIHPFHFYKVIEIIVRTERQLSRDVVKHLHLIEEQVLDSMSWQSSSPLWDIIANNQPVFTSEEVSCTVMNYKSTGHPDLNQCVKYDLSRMVIDKIMSPVKFQSPKKEPIASKTKKESVLPKIESICPKKEPGIDQEKPGKRKGSLELFFRKFYHLAGLRLEDLCERLQIENKETRLKIWACIEYVIITHTDVMRNRHLDQIIMCATYVAHKVLKMELPFQDIMKAYRCQPQAASHIYRSVLLSVKSEQQSSSSEEVQTSSSDEEERGDLIKFYNRVFTKIVQDFALQFSKSTSQGLCIKLSPVPVLRNIPSPYCRVSDTQRVYIRNMDSLGKATHENIPTKKNLSYIVQKSPAKDLRAINDLIQGRIKSEPITEIVVDEEKIDEDEEEDDEDDDDDEEEEGEGDDDVVEMEIEEDDENAMDSQMSLDNRMALPPRNLSRLHNLIEERLEQGP